MQETNLNSKQRLKQANKTTIVGALLNILLSSGKLVAGILGRSQAMIADAIHSLSDLGSDFAVIVGMVLASRPKDKTHNYGHGKFETLATVIIAVILLTVGIGIGWGSIKSIVFILNGNKQDTPHLIAFWAALISVAVKEGLFRYTLNKGKRVNSPAVIANAYHHRSDAYSSLGTALGIGGAILLGNEWVILDPIAGVIVSLLIIKEALSIGIKSLNELLDAALPVELQDQILSIAFSVPGVYKPHNLKTRRIGNIISVDLHIYVESNISIEEAHDLSHKVELAIRNKVDHDFIFSIHTEPVSLIKS